MPSVCAERLGFSYLDRVLILDNIDFRLSPGWYGLVGANGMGKTTLAKLIAGELQPTRGRLRLEPRHAEVVICRQELDHVDPDVARFAASNDRESSRQRGLLGLELATFEHFDQLSAGERKRWQIAAVLATRPDVLIVDEPTNHLDQEGREHLVRALSQFRGVGIIISHDRALLDTLTRATLCIHAGKVATLPLRYSEARSLWHAEAQRAEGLRQDLRQREQELEKRIRAANRDRQAAHKQRSARTRMKSIHDHDGSSFAQTGRAANGEASISRRISVMSTELTRVSQMVPEFVVDKTLGRSLFVDYQPAPKRRILSLTGEDVQAGERIILRNTCVALERDARVHLKGSNGAGKTTLLKALLLRSTASQEQILYLPQELDAEQVASLTASSRELPRTERGRIMAILAALGVDPDRLIGSATCSPGEARKLKLAFGLATHAWALVLDEPTNHLDLESIERLELALAAYPGALLIVSHDPAFARSCTNSVWEIREGRLVT